ncbi:MAG: Ig-like domain-containing protein, partial [Lachnospiraceae bacterium]|nr:Ig-like domain-containing protein [Lachnospiraceae bacterium]
VTWVASCVITVNVAATDFMITPDHAEIEVGQSITLHTNIDAQKANIEWISSDTSMLTVSANDGNISAEVTALNKVGTAVITAFNMDNKAYATCVITVTAPITSIRIDKGVTYTTTLAEGFVFLKALYEPSNATATDLVWTARNFNASITDPVATVDANGVVTLLTEGETIITVEPKYNPNRVQAQCIITVKEDPITEIKTDVSELEMVVGDVYQVTTTIKPESPSDPTLNWSVVSGDTVVSVDAEGRITALTAGTAVVMVQGNPRKDGKSPAMATIAVTVRNRLQSIEFADKYVEVEEEGQLQLEVLFTPDDSVNRTLHFASADTDIATVTDDGVVTGVSIGGPVVITCWAEDIGKQSPIQCYVTVVKKKIPATDFDIDPASKTVSVGSSFTINTIFTPENTSDKTVKFASADSSVAKVDANGKVTGVKTGVTAIVCTATQSGLVKSCTVTVVPAVKLRLSPSSREIAKGQSFTIKKIVTPSNANSAATWKSSNSAIASVSSSGKVKGKKLGSCTITCTLTQSGVKATCRVKVAKLRTSIKLNKTNIRIGVGQSYRLKKTISTNASKNPSVKWKSSNKRVASVSSGGKVKGKRVGATKITVTTKDAIKAKASCRVTVIRRVTSVKMSREFATCFVGHTTQLKATVRPKKASIKKLKWTSSDTKIARVSSIGKVTGISAGEVTITAKAKDGSGKKAQCIVRILEETPVSSIVVAQTNMTMKRGDQAKLTYSVLPNNNSDSLSFASDNKRVATVSKSGVVKAVGTGNATITIMSSGGVSATVTVNVVAMNKSSLNMRQYDTETLMVFGTQDTVTWYSSNSRVATVSSSGLVTGRGVGSTYIYAYVNGCKVACKVTITTVNG